MEPTIDDAIRAKSQLADKISALLREYEDMYKMPISDVDIIRVCASAVGDMVPQFILSHVELRIKL